MIGRLTGRLLEKQPPALIIDVNGVGYEVEAPMSTFYKLPVLGEQVTLHTHLHVREDAQQLYGFAELKERQLFRDLIKISGVGAKLALTVLSGISVEDFIATIHGGDANSLTKLPGIGRKTAERLVMEMRDKLDADGELPGTSLPTGSAGAGQDALSALQALGYKPAEAARLLKKVSAPDLSSEELIRLALKQAVSG
ncbi:MAG: Holliday junction branch migration protein RuvA [Salinisphaeraceae bacterium]|nr:Holliday junction branch migration protein RuvA [Salinisphaeraceae bacterium]